MRRFLRGFYFAAAGLVGCFKTERNMRVHFCAAFYVLYLARFFSLTRTELCVVILTIGAVIAAEAFNTAIEAAVDKCSPEPHPLAKKAKDAAAGGVLAIAVAAAAVGLVIFGDVKKLSQAAAEITSSGTEILWLVISAAVWAVVLISPVGKKSDDRSLKYRKDKEREQWRNQNTHL